MYSFQLPLTVQFLERTTKNVLNNLTKTEAYVAICSHVHFMPC